MTSRTAPTPRPLQVIVVAAHPDEPEEYAGGLAAAYAEAGHHVKFLTLTNGSAGHATLGAAELVARRAREAHLAAERLGVAEYEIYDDVDDGSLVPTLDLRMRVIRSVRRWRADVVVGFHPDGGGHPDNRAAGRILADALHFTELNNVLPAVPTLSAAPLYLLMPDYATTHVHRHDIAVDLAPVLERKLRGCDAHASQFYEFSSHGQDRTVPPADDWAGRRAYLLEHWRPWFEASEDMRDALAVRYGKKQAAQVMYAESFQLAPGRRVFTPDELAALLPPVAA
ncbi:PIG-L deacetylase family protein [Streptomyces sp. NPDC057565]|uniref:PIG-L deacetylase family protein n=1 Tax=Streptomyces sp. NPDC057565 TaxID=3346169 RepID=UPI003674CDA1